MGAASFPTTASGSAARGHSYPSVTIIMLPASNFGKRSAMIRRMDLTNHLLALPDGRSLCFAEWGDPAGFPVLTLHGTPGSRLNRHPDAEQYARAGARVITYDRPGYGGSTRRPGRSVVDCVEDVAALADHLGLDRFAVTGGSGGGPHALAVAARLGDRVVRCRCVVGVAPYGA